MAGNDNSTGILAIAGLGMVALALGGGFGSSGDKDLLPGQTRGRTNAQTERITGFPTPRTPTALFPKGTTQPEDQWPALAQGAALTLVHEWNVRQQLTDYVVSTNPSTYSRVFGRHPQMPGWIHWRDSFNTQREYLYVHLIVEVKDPLLMPHDNILGDQPVGRFPYMFWIDQRNGFAVVDFWFGDPNGFWRIVSEDRQTTYWEYVAR